MAGGPLASGPALLCLDERRRCTLVATSRWVLANAKGALNLYEIHTHPDPCGAVVHLRVAVGSAVGRI